MNTGKDSQEIRLVVKVTPNAGRNEITGFKENVLQVKVGAPPDKGKANKELIDFLAERLGIKKSAIRILGGLTSRNKTLVITGINREEMMSRLTLN